MSLQRRRKWQEYSCWWLSSRKKAKLKASSIGLQTMIQELPINADWSAAFWETFPGVPWKWWPFGGCHPCGESQRKRWSNELCRYGRNCFGNELNIFVYVMLVTRKGHVSWCWDHLCSCLAHCPTGIMEDPSGALATLDSLDSSCWSHPNWCCILFCFSYIFVCTWKSKKGFGIQHSLSRHILRASHVGGQ